MGKVLSTAKGYGVGGEALYAYISGDITKSYHEESVNFVRRNMLTVFTENKNCPLVMLVHDTVEAKDKNFRKSFLLHTNNEPTLNKEEMSAYATFGEGRITLRSLYGANAMEKIGGEGKAYWISNSDFYNSDGTLCGKNCTDEFSPTDNSELIWGRLEIICQGKECEELLNLIVVTDKDVEAQKPTAFSDKDGVLTVEIMDILAAFVTKAAEHRAEYTVTVTNPEGARCHIAGLDMGQWQIKTSAGDCTTVTITEDSSVLSFFAKPGEVKLIKNA